MKMAVFWVVASCSLVGVYRHFRSSCCLHHHPDGGSKHLFNVSKLLPDCMAQQPRRQSSSCFIVLDTILINETKILLHRSLVLIFMAYSNITVNKLRLNNFVTCARHCAQFSHCTHGTAVFYFFAVGNIIQQIRKRSGRINLVRFRLLWRRI
jgi:hypothetical protein